MQVARCLPVASALLLLLQGGAACAREYHVDAGAGGGGDGSPQQPFAAIQQAADVMKPGDVCLVHEGVYRETVRPANSGTADRPLIFRAMPGEKAVLSGCRPVTAWTHEKGLIYSAAAPMRLGHENQVFAGGKMLLEARWPNAGQPVPKGLLEFDVAMMDPGTTPTKIVDDALPELDLAEAHVWVSTHKRWYCWTGAVRGKTQGAIEIEDNSDRKGNHVCKPGGDYYLFGARSLLDSSGEWFYDGDSGRLYVGSEETGRPPRDVEIKVRKHVFDLRGRRHISIEGIEMLGASLATDDESAHLTLDGVRARYVDHSNLATRQYGSQSDTGMAFRGRGHVIRNCEIAYSSGNCVALFGSNFLVVNNYIHDGNYLLYYNNTVSDAKWSYRSTWAAAQAKDLYGCRLVNNVDTSGMTTNGEGLLTSHNTWHFEGLCDKRFPKPGTAPIDSGRVIPTITDRFAGSAPDRGAYESGVSPWRAGHDFGNPPETIDTSFREPPARNRIVNAAFHRGELHPWKPFGKHVRIVRDSHSQWVTDAKSMMGGQSAELGPGRCGLRQTVHGLEPGASYELMAMFRVPEDAAARLRVEGYGGPPLTSEAMIPSRP